MTFIKTLFHTKTDDIYKDLNDITDEMDFSDYSIYHKYYDTRHK